MCRICVVSKEFGVHHSVQEPCVRVRNVSSYMTKVPSIKMADAVKFSSGEKEVIERKLEVSFDRKSDKRDMLEFYEISRCVDVINRRDFQKVNIQQLLTWTATDIS